MSVTIFGDNPQTMELLRSMTRLMTWMRSVQPVERQRFWAVLADCSDEQQAIILRMLDVMENLQSTPSERQQALSTIADTIGLNPDSRHEAMPSVASATSAPETQQARFAQRLHELMDAKHVSQQELARRVGCTQPAISQMLNRSCRPQKKTLMKLAEALNVAPRDLWPELEVAEMLDAVESFQEDGHVMTFAEAAALADTSSRNPPGIPARSLPKRHR